jgi:hypothetical protein
MGDFKEEFHSLCSLNFQDPFEFYLLEDLLSAVNANVPLTSLYLLVAGNDDITVKGPRIRNNIRRVLSFSKIP